MDSKKIDTGFLVRCDIGDEIVASLAGFAAKNGIHSGTVTGIGAVEKVVLGYFDKATKQYIRKEFDGIFELLNLSGNFAKKDQDTILHCHAVISDKEFNVFGGHLFSAVVAITGEFYIMPGGKEIRRGPDQVSGLNLIKL